MHIHKHIFDCEIDIQIAKLEVLYCSPTSILGLSKPLKLFLHLTLQILGDLAIYTLYFCMCVGQRSSVKNHNPVPSPNKTGSARKIAALRQKLHGEKVRNPNTFSSCILFFTSLGMN